LSAHLLGKNVAWLSFISDRWWRSGMAPIFVQTSQCKKMKLVFSAI
jgi:hypothetical protein